MAIILLDLINFESLSSFSDLSQEIYVLSVYLQLECSNSIGESYQESSSNYVNIVILQQQTRN